MMSNQDINNLWSAYWKGDGNIYWEILDIDLINKKRLESGVIYEYLIEGRVELI